MKNDFIELLIFIFLTPVLSIYDLIVILTSHHREIDKLDGCVYSCPIYPGVWSDWCDNMHCKYYLDKDDENVYCRRI